MEEFTVEEIFEKQKDIAEETYQGLHDLENNVKETIKLLVMDQWDPENLEIMDQLSDLIEKSEVLKETVSKQDLEISQLRETISDKRKHLSQSKLLVDLLKSNIGRLEKALVIPKQYQRDLVISEQSQQIFENFESFPHPSQQSAKKPISKSPKIESIESNKFVPIPGTYQGIYMSRLACKPEDKGKQELNMPFLSSSAHNWISSLRTPTKSPLRGDKK